MATILLATSSVFAQATLSGVVKDLYGRAVAGVPVVAEDTHTGETHTTYSTAQGYYQFERLPPGEYRLSVRFDQFEPIVDQVSIVKGFRSVRDVKLRLHRDETVNVYAARSQPTAGPETLLDGAFTRQDIETLPHTNGRTLQTFLSLVPGVVVTDSVGTLAQFTAIGQRRFANRLTIDGISADLAIDVRGTGIGEAGSGSLPASATSGGTQTLVSLAAIEEIQVRTANVPPEQARTPGAQTSVVTRAGGERFTASAFTDIRPNGLAASDWFSNAGEQPKREMHFWNVGTSAGGPALPKRLFYFATWEQQHIDRPVSTTIRVPSDATREAAPPSVQPLLNAFPRANGQDLGGGFAEYSNKFPVASHLWTLGARIDVNVSAGCRLFARINVGDSGGDALGGAPFQNPFLSHASTEATRTRTLTGGMTSVLSSAMTNDVRFNTTVHGGSLDNASASYGNAEPLPLGDLAPGLPADTFVFVRLFSGPNGFVSSGRVGGGDQKQIQIADTLSWRRGRHQWRFGADYARIAASSAPPANGYNYQFAGLAQAFQQKVASVLLMRSTPARALRESWSAFAQDTFRVTSRLSLDYGLRYSVKPAPVSLSDTSPLLIDFDALPQARFLPEGSGLWDTSWTNFAPSISATYQLRGAAGRETALRAGWGLIFDDQTRPGAIALGGGYPYFTSRTIAATRYPLPQDEATGDGSPAPFAAGDTSTYFAFPRHFKVPRTHAWQIGIDQAVGDNERVGLAYVGTAARDLAYWYAYPVNSTRLSVNAYSNVATSDYHALLLEFVRRQSRGWQARVAYTWSHALDLDSGEALSANPPPELISPASNRGSADFDRRHVLQATASYRIPTAPRTPRLVRPLFSNWQVDVVASIRSGAPVSVETPRSLGLGFYALRLDRVPGEQLWIADPDVPTGHRINPDAFQVPTEARQGTFGRNALQASPLRQIDLSLSRSMRVGSRVTVRARLDAFNVFNIPNFGPPVGLLVAQFGRPVQSYAATLGTGTLAQGGLTPVQQAGGPRSIQLSVRLGL